MDDKVSVEILARIEGLLGEIAKAQKAILDFSKTTQSSLDKLNGTFSTLKSTIASIATIAIGGGFLKSFVDAAVASGTAASMLSRNLGMTVEEASVLKVELDLLGIEAKDYVAAAGQLDRQLRTNEDTLRSVGMVTRDSNRQLLGQKELMQSAITWLSQYKAGTDRNIAAQTAFGKGAGDTILQLTKMSAETRRVAQDTADALGQVVTPEQAANVTAYKNAVRQMNLTLDGIKSAIGDAVLPYLTKFMQWFRDQGPSIITNMKSIVKDAVEIAFSVATALVTTFTNVIIGIYNLFVTYQYVMLNLGRITKAEFERSTDEMGAFVDKVGDARDKIVAVIKDLKNKVLAGGPAPPIPDAPTGGTKSASGLVDIAGQRGAAQAAAEGQLAILRERYAREKMMIEAAADQFKISNAEKYSSLIDLANKEYELERQALQKKIGLLGADKAARAKANQELLLLEEKHITEIMRLNQQAMAARQQEVQGYVGTVESSWNSGLRGMLAGTTSVFDTMKKVLGDFVIYAIEQFQKKFIFEKATAALTTALFGGEKAAEVAIHTSAEAAKTAATATGEGARQSIGAAGLAASLGRAVTDAFGWIAASVGKIFAELTAWLVPIFGPFAPAAALGIATGVGVAAYGMVKGFDTGTPYVQRSGLAMIHKGEAVVPAEANQGWPGGPGGGRSPIQIVAWDGESVDRWLKRGGAEKLAGAVAGAQNKNRSLRPDY